MGNTRKLILTRERKFNEGTANWPILLDGKKIGYLGKEETKEFKISQEAHRVSFIRPCWEGQVLVDKEIKIVDMPPSFLDWHIHIASWTNFFTSELNVEITEDQAQAEYNKKVWNEYLKDKENRNTIDAVINDILKDPIGTRDFSKINQLPNKNKETEYFRKSIYSIRNIYCKELLESYYEKNELGINTVFIILKELEVIDLISEQIKSLTKHYDYIVKEKKFLYSVLTENFVEELKNISGASKDVPDEIFVIEKRIRELIDKHDIHGAINLLMMSDYSSTTYDAIKRFFLMCALLEGTKQEYSKAYQGMFEIMKYVFQTIAVKDDKILLVKNVDTIIAETLRYKNTNSISKVNEILSEFLTITCQFYNVDGSQYTLLQKIFNYYGAYEQEKMVLEAMVTNCISRTPEQEQRLEFLKKTKTTNLRNSNDIISEESIPEDKFVYEYRFVGYNDTDLKNYFNDLSLRNKTLDKPVVVREWNKSISVDSFKYDIEKLGKHLKSTINDNFPNRYKLGIVSAGIASTGELAYERAYTDAILILDDITYNWLAFYIEGEQLLKNKVTFSIYAVYMPMFDLFVESEEDIYRQNERICNKIEVLKKQMNPKFNTYMNTIIEVIIEDLENWLNNSGSSNSIYE